MTATGRSAPVARCIDGLNPQPTSDIGGALASDIQKAALTRERTFAFDTSTSLADAASDSALAIKVETPTFRTQRVAPIHQQRL